MFQGVAVVRYDQLGHVFGGGQMVSHGVQGSGSAAMWGIFISVKMTSIMYVQVFAMYSTRQTLIVYMYIEVHFTESNTFNVHVFG